MSSGTLRVMSWNVLYRDLDARAQGIVEVVKVVDPDIVLLQETNPSHARSLADAVGMTVVGCGAESTASGPTSVPALLANLGRVSAVADSSVVLRDADRDFAALHRFDVRGVEILVSSVHLQHTFEAGRMGLDKEYAAAASGAESVDRISDPTIRESVETRLRQIEQITEVAATGPDGEVSTILGGDFNFVPFGVEHRRFVDNGYLDAWVTGPRLGSRDTILEHNPLIGDGVGVYAHAANEQLPGSSGTLDYTLDFHFVKNIRCTAAWIAGRPDSVLPTWHSDHLALVADYAVG